MNTSQIVNGRAQNVTTVEQGPECKRWRLRSNLVLFSPLVFFLLCVLLCAACYPVAADARVKGRCKDCHDMHSDKPFPALTKDGCLGCHGMKPNGDQSIITLGKTRIPQVIHHMDGGELAAGNFYYVADAFTPDYGKGHNVQGISRLEDPPMDIPPGFIGNVRIPGGTGPKLWPQGQQLTCAGTWGCHGDRNIEDPFKSIAGAHHEDDRVIDGSTVGKSYRFLFGITGKEHKDWEYLATIDNHNGYRGDIDQRATDTISYLCGECHAKFHPNPFLGGVRDVGEAYYTPWIRHPGDIALSAGNVPFAGSEYQNFIRYSLEVPVGFDKPTGGEVFVDMNSVVICLSCHRAHASSHQDSLRWDYYGMISHGGAQGTGCLTCHTRKGGDH
jgi:hypothetical protein